MARSTLRIEMWIFFASLLHSSRVFGPGQEHPCQQARFRTGRHTQPAICESPTRRHPRSSTMWRRRWREPSEPGTGRASGASHARFPARGAAATGGRDRAEGRPTRAAATGERTAARGARAPSPTLPARSPSHRVPPRQYGKDDTISGSVSAASMKAPDVPLSLAGACWASTPRRRKDDSGQLCLLILHSRIRAGRGGLAQRSALLGVDGQGPAERRSALQFEEPESQASARGTTWSMSSLRASVTVLSSQ